jgi:hypothetical protein
VKSQTAKALAKLRVDDGLLVHDDPVTAEPTMASHSDLRGTR